MKTIEEFIYRLQHDPEFEQQAHAFEKSDEFMHFVRDEGYDFTLDQLLDLFREGEPPQEPTNEPPAVSSPLPGGVEAFIQRLEEDPEFERQARAFDNDEAFMEFVRAAGYDFNLDQLTAWFKRNHNPVTPEDQGSPIATPVQAPPPPQPPDSASLPTTDSSPPEAPVLEPSRKFTPKFEGMGGGRRRGMKWHVVD